MKMQKTLTVQRRNGSFEEMPEEMALDPRLQKKHGWIVVNVPKTVEELKAVVHPFADNEVFTEHEQAVKSEQEVETDGVIDGATEVKKRGRKPKA